MIISKQKDFNILLKKVGKGPVFIIGCSECATICGSGGEKEVLEMKEDFKKNNVLVTGWVVLDPACHLNNDKRLLKMHHKELEKSKKIIVLACGNGVQTVAEIINDKEIIPGTDSLFLGEIKRLTEFERRCEMCGECIQDSFDCVCPVTRCPKSMLNGPCGGSVDGMCEVDPDLECIWDVIIKKLSDKGQLDKLKKIMEPKDWSKSLVTKRSIK